MADFTPEDQAQLTALQAKQVQAAYEVNEASRVARLAAITPVAASLGSLESINAMVATLKASRTTVDADTAIRLDRIVQVMSVDAISILFTAQQLAVPIPPPSSSTGSA